MSKKELTKSRKSVPSVFDDFFKPWNEWFGNGGLGGQTLTIPAANIIENKNDYKVSLAAPGLQKSDFNIDVEGNILTISCEKEESREEKDERHTRKEYNFSSFSRSFTIPEEVMKDNIEALYEKGVLTLVLPKTEKAKKESQAKHISVK